MTDRKLETTTEIGRLVYDLGHLALAITLASSHVSAMLRLKAGVHRHLLEY